MRAVTAPLNFSDDRAPLLDRLAAAGYISLDKRGRPTDDYSKWVVDEWLPAHERQRRRRRTKDEMARDKKARR